jgi:hypothetical protein
MQSSTLRSFALASAVLGLSLAIIGPYGKGQEAPPKSIVRLPSSKVLLNPLPGQPQRTNSFLTAVALSPDGRYLALLNNGRGTEESGYQQSISALDLQTNRLFDYPDARLQINARQTFFLGLAFSDDGMIDTGPEFAGSQTLELAL